MGEHLAEIPAAGVVVHRHLDEVNKFSCAWLPKALAKDAPVSADNGLNIPPRSHDEVRGIDAQGKGFRPVIKLPVPAPALR